MNVTSLTSSMRSSIVLAHAIQTQRGYLMFLLPNPFLLHWQESFSSEDSRIILMVPKPKKVVTHCSCVPSAPHPMATWLLDTFEKQRQKPTLHPTALDSCAREWSQLKNEIPLNLLPLLEASAGNSFCLFISRQQLFLLWLITLIFFIQPLQKGEYYCREYMGIRNR